MRLMVIMFTDLVGSTGLKEQIGSEQYRKLKEKHDGFVKRALEQAPTGKVLQDTGDGYFISFSSVAHAVSAALTFQYLMTREAWPHPFKTRVGVHLGEVEEGHSQVTGQADFISSAIDQASRTMSLAVGGQILLTRTVFESARLAVREHPPVEAGAPVPVLSWMAHGAYLFKGCTEPVDVYEVGARGVAPLTPPPDSEKAKRASTATIPTGGTGGVPVPGPVERPRRTILKAALIGIPAAALAGAWLLRSKPSPIEDQRGRIERDVEILRKLPPQAAPIPENIKDVDRVVVGNNAGYDIITDNRVFDMRGWKEVPQDALSERISQVTLRRRLHLSKTAKGDTFEMQARTSGLDVNLSCGDPYPCSYEAQKGESFVGQERMKVRKVTVDVSKVEIGREFDLNLHVTYWNSLQTETEQWFGMIGYANSERASLLLVFPPKKPFKEFELMTARTEKDTPVPFSGERRLLMSREKDWIYWEVLKPEVGHVYKLHWKW